MSQEIDVMFTVDWVSATFTPEQAKRFGFKVGWRSFAAEVKGVPQRGYDNCEELETGLRVSWSSTRDEMGVYFSFSGQCLRWYETKSLGWHELMFMIGKYGGRTSRVDLAFDVRGSRVSFPDFGLPKLLPNVGRGRNPKWLPVGNDEVGWTVYVGSRASEKYLRVYDKAKERGDYVGDYIRIELETKGETGHAVGWNFSQKNKDECVAMARTLVMGTANFDNAAWRAIVSGNTVEFSLPQGKDRDTYGWLVNVVAPSLAKEIAKRPNHDVLGDFWDALRRELNQRGIVPYIEPEA
ncbi:MAG TPA: replication initiation factor domain-containing protein [Oculatellaceae cyanobacterium]